MVTPNYAPPAQAQPQGNGIAIAGMVCGIVGLVLFFLGIFGMIVALLGIIFGAVGLAKSKRVGRGKGAAMAGLICGVLGIIAGVLFYVVIINAITKGLGESKQDLTKVRMHKITQDWFPRWSLMNSDKACPDSLLEVGRAIDSKMSESELQDFYGRPFKVMCGDQLPAGARGLALLSFGEDGKEGTSDDIRSW
jgi:hypothetical protein